MEANTAQNDLQAFHQLALLEAGQVWPALGVILEHGSPILKALSSLSPLFLKWTNVLQNHSQSWPQWASVQKSKQVDVLEVVLGCGGLKLKVVRVICSLLHFTT